ncbi:MAG: PAS domain S-box protein [Caldilinea sp. CFX5]|nr:PAS domain S-box protein [Caldilinea sp. CFX5]
MIRFLDRRQFYFPLWYWLPLFWIVYSLALTIFLFAFHRQQEGSWYNFILAVGTLSALAVGIFAIFYIAVNRRVDHLIGIVNQFAQGDLTTRVTLSGADEFVAIGAAFNQMAEQLAAQRQKHEQAEAALQANQELMQDLLARLDVVVWSTDYDQGHYHYISPAIEQIYGRPVAAFQQNHNLWREIIYPADLPLVLEAYELLETTGTKQIEFRIIRPDGTMRWLLQRSLLVRDAAGRPRRFDGVVTDITAYKQEQMLQAERMRLDTLRAEVGTLLAQSNALPVILQKCAEAVVMHLDAAFVRIWTFNRASQLLELQASAGLYTHLDGSHSRIAVGQFIIGQIAQQRLPHVTNDLLSLAHISDRSWAQREGIAAFAGYPLIVESEVVGVIAAFVRQPFSLAVLDNLAFVAGGLAQLIERKQTEAALQASEERFRLAIEGARNGVWDWNVTTGEIVANEQWAALLGYKLQEIKPHIDLWNQLIHPDDIAIVDAAFNAYVAGHLSHYECEHRVYTKSGEWKWVLDRAQIVSRDADGHVLRVTGIIEDIHARKQAELVLQNFFRLSLDLLCIADINGYFRYVNPAFEQTLGIAKADLLAKPFFTFIHPNDVAATQAQVTRLANGQEVIDFENRYQHKDGSYRWLSWRAAAMTDSGLLYAVARDITEQKRQHQLVEQTHVAAQVGGWELDFVTNQLFWTAETYRIHDTTPADYQPTVESAIAFYTPESIPIVNEAVHRAMRDGTPWDFELELITARQRRIWVHAVGKVEIEEGRAIRAYGSFQDITERKRLALLMEQTHRAAHVGGWELDYMTNKLYWTDETYRIHDTTPARYQPTIETAIGFYAPESAPVIAAAVQHGIAAGEPWDLELEMITAQQRRIWVHTVGEIQLAHGRPVKASGSIQDITTRKATEAALRQSEARNRAILDALPDAVFVTDKEGLLLDTLSKDAGVYDMPVHQFLGKPVDEVLPPPVGQRIRTTIDEAAKGVRQVIEYPLTLQGVEHYFEARLVALDSDKVLTIVRDITEQKQAEAERFIRKIAEAVPHTMYVYDLDEERYVYINHQARQNFGYSPDEIMGMGAAFFTNHLHHDDITRFPELLARWHGAGDGQVFETEYQLRHRNGEWRWFAGRDTIFHRNFDGRVRQIIGTAHDITEYKRAQQQILAALKEKEALLKEVHHRVKNNLQIITSLLNLQAAQIKDTTVLQIFIETKNRVRSMALLHETLYSTENLARIDFARYVDSLCAHLFRSYGVDPQRIGLQTAIAGGTLDLDQAIPCGLIINELVSNAIKYAFPDERTGTVWVALQPYTAHQYQLCVRDNGVGLPVALDLIRTESLGLRLVHDLTLQLNGELTVTRTAGAAFTILFER